MKKDRQELFFKAMTGVSFLLILFFILFYLTGCRTPKQLHDKAILKGYVEKTKIDSVLVAIPVKGDKGKDTTIYIKVAAECPDPEIITKWEYKIIKQQEKTERTEARTDRKEAVQERKAVESNNKTKIKEKRIEKRSFWWLWILVGILLGRALRYILNKRINFNF